MHRLRRLALAGLLGGTVVLPAALPAARADSTTASCSFSRHDHTVAVETGPCTFSQRQGNVTVRFGERTFHFPSDEQGRTYERSHSSEGIRFNREGDFTLQVRWRTQQAPIAKPPGWERDNRFLGRWLGESRAGRAVIEVLTVEPHRIRWGNAANGICDGDYSVELLPRDGRGPAPNPDPEPGLPLRPSGDRGFRVARLTLRPGPCSTGDAVIELAMPLQGSGELEVVTYGVDGRLIGQYGGFTRLGGPGGGRAAHGTTPAARGSGSDQR